MRSLYAAQHVKHQQLVLAILGNSVSEECLDLLSFLENMMRVTVTLQSSALGPW
jgi:hypothetical protein